MIDSDTPDGGSGTIGSEDPDRPDRCFYERFGADRRAVSETVGYVLIFALVVSTVGVVTVGGFDTLDTRQEAEQVANVERAFDVMADNLADIARHGDRSRATEIRLADGQLRVDDPVTVRTGTYDNDFTEGNATAVAHPIVYELDDRQVIYGFGAIFRSDDGDSLMIQEPRATEDDGTLSIAVLQTLPASSQEQAIAPTTSLVVADRGAGPPSTASEQDSEGDQIAVQIEADRPELWAELFEEYGFEIEEDEEETEEAGTIVLTSDHDRLTVASEIVFVSIEG